MSHRIIENYLDHVRNSLTGLPRRDRDAALTEIRQHLDAEVKRLQADEDLAADAAAREACLRFGEPEDLAVAYTPSGNVVTGRTGEVLLRIAGATGRGIGTGLAVTAKWLGIIVLALLGAGVLITAAALVFADEVLDTFEDDIRESVPRPLYSYSQSWQDTDLHTSTNSESFDVRDGVKEFWIEFDIRSDTGCARIVLTDPSGDTRFDSENVCNGETLGRSFTFSELGQWRIQYIYGVYSGSISVDALYFQESPLRG